MAPLKCCVGGCESTSDTARLYCLPKNDHLRDLWLSFLVPTNALLLGLTKDQLVNRRVCHKHFDRQQFDLQGRRLPYSYPCLFTEKEIKQGEPLGASETRVTDHNYSLMEDDGDDVNETMLVISQTAMNEHSYCKKQNIYEVDSQPSCSYSQAMPSLVCNNMPEDKSNARTAPSHDPVVIKSLPHSNTTPRQARVPEDKSNARTAPSHDPVVIKSLPHSNTTPRQARGSINRKLGSKQRQFVNKIKNITAESVGLTGSERLSLAETHASNKKLMDNFHHLNKQAQTFLIMQLRECRKKKMARRFTLNEKLIALLIFKQSPKEYKLLENMFALPSKRTLHRLAEKISMKPGLNPQIFSFIEKKTKNWDLKKKLCTLVFDEVALTPHVSFDEKQDLINGFVDSAEDRQQKFCDHALVFMLRGICSPWRQTVAYYFTEGAVSSPVLQNILKKIVQEVANTGLTLLGLVCDQGSTFKTTIKKLREDTLRLRNAEKHNDDGTVHIAGHNLNIFFDPPHLLKGMRNNFLNKNLIWEGKKASWNDIQFIYDLDSKLGHTRALPKLTEHHVNPCKVKKMKVSIATQVLSARTASMLKYTNALNVHHTGTPGTMETTAEVVEFLDKLFDSVNGSAGSAVRGKLRKAVKPNSGHVEFWTDAIKKFKTIVFEDSSSKASLRTGRARLVRVPTLEGWITTLESFVRLTKLLFEQYSVDYYYPRNVNQDPLENFFGRIRALNYRNNNPDANTFTNAFKSLLLTNILSPHSKFANCEADNGESIIDIGFLFEEIDENKENQSPNISLPLSVAQEHSSGSISKDDVMMEKIKVHCSAYTAGYICRKLTKNIKCKSCLSTYTSSSVEGIHSYIKHREYASLKNDNLVYPSEKVLITYRRISTYVHAYLDKNCHKAEILKTLLKAITSRFGLFWLGCANHQKVIETLFIKYIAKLQVYNWCNTINKILKGRIEKKHVSKIYHVPQLALKKYQTYIVRKKTLNK